MPDFVWEIPSPTIETDGAVSVAAAGAIDHVAAATKRLVIQFRKPKMKAMVRAFVSPMQELENTIIDLLTNRTIDTAVGAQLLVIGRIVGQPVVDVTETTYRSLVRARIPANKSDGMGNDVLLVARLLFTDWVATAGVVAAGTMKLRLLNYGTAAFVLRVEDVDLPWDLAQLFVEQFLEVITAAGVRGVLQFQTWIEADGYTRHNEAFQFGDSGGGANAEGGGLAHVAFSSWKITRDTGGGTWDAGASSVETIAGDGYVETVVDQVDEARAFGMSAVDADQDYTTIDYAFMLKADGTLEIYESGVLKASPGAYALGDVLRVYRIAGTVEYKVGGLTLYTSATPSAGAVRLDTSIRDWSGRLQELKLFDYPTVQVPISAWSDDVFVATLAQGLAADTSADYGGHLAAALE